MKLFLGCSSLVRLTLLAVSLSALFARNAGAQDIVVAAPADNQRPTQWTGEILDSTGRELRMRTTAGIERVFPQSRVVSTRTTYSPGQIAGDALLAQGQFAAALEKYRSALDSKNPEHESRVWVQRLVAAQMVWCYRGLGQIEQAGDLFLLIAARDPDTPSFDAIPLAWLNSVPAAGIENKARVWLVSDRPVSRLLGASQLLATPLRNNAIAELQQLTKDRDERIAWLAQTQLWHAEAFQAAPGQINVWERAIEKVPEPLRAGPYFIVGKALVRHAPERAALVLLRVPILYPREQLLARAALDMASQMLANAGQNADAARIKAQSLTDTAEPSDAHDERFLRGLRELRLFTMAENYCQERLRDSAITAARRVELTIELSRTYAEHALQTAPAERAPLWKRAHEVAGDFVRENPRSGRLLLVRTQAALAALAQGELARQEIELAAPDEAVLENARASIRAAVASLKQLDDDVTAELVRRARIEAQGDQLTAPELSSLQTHLRYQLARAFRNQGLLYAEGSNDRLNAITQALEKLDSISDLADDDPLKWPSLLDVVTCYRLMRDTNLAEQRLTQLVKQTPPTQIANRVAAESLRLLLARGRLAEANTLAQQYVPTGPAGSGDFEYARLEASLTSWREASQQRVAADAARWEKASADQVRHITATQGPYWARRAEMLLARSIGRSVTAESSAALLQAAAAFYRSGQHDEAIAGYDRATAAAKAAGDDNTAFNASIAAAQIEQQRQHHEPASARYRKAAQSSPQHPQAASAHLLAIYYAGQAAQSPQSPGLKLYGDLLEEHLQSWPRSDTTGQAAWQLGVLREHEGNWPAAVQAYALVPVEHAQYVTAIEGASRASTAWIGQAGAKQAEVTAAASKFFDERLLGADRRLPERWTPAARAAALALAQIELTSNSGNPRRAEQYLTAALQSPEPAAAAWKTAAQTLLVAALARQNRPAEAQRLLAQISQGSLAELIALVESLDRVTTDAASDARRQLATLELQALTLLDPLTKQLTEPQLRVVRRVHASALSDLGRWQEALAEWQTLARQYPRDGLIQEGLATSLGDSGDPQLQLEALTRWHEIIDKTKSGSPRWFRAHLAFARVQLAQGKKSQARSTIKVVELGYPDFGGGEMKGKFQALLALCES